MNQHFASRTREGSRGESVRRRRDTQSLARKEESDAGTRTCEGRGAKACSSRVAPRPSERERGSTHEASPDRLCTPTSGGRESDPPQSKRKLQGLGGEQTPTPPHTMRQTARARAKCPSELCGGLDCSGSETRRDHQARRSPGPRRRERRQERSSQKTRGGSGEGRGRTEAGQMEDKKGRNR